MDDFRLQVFVAAARELNFSRAAERLCVSQPAVSRHIRELESRYNVRLFIRSGGSLALTPAGATLLRAAERVQEEYRRLEYEMGLCVGNTEGELRLGASTTISQYLLPPVLARFTARFPGVRVSLFSGNSHQVEQALEAQRIDLGMVESVRRRQGLHYALFAPDELVLISRADGKRQGPKTVTPDELRELPLVLREDGSGTLEVICRALAGKGIRLTDLRVVMRLGTTEGIKAFVRNSDALAIVSVTSLVDELRSGSLRIVDIEDLILRRDFCFVTAESAPVSLAQRFMDFARAGL